MKIIISLLFFVELSSFASPYKDFQSVNHLELTSIEKSENKVISEVELTPLSEESANIIFHSMKKLSYIPYDFIEDGCYAQAHEISLVLKEFEISSAKIFIKSKNGKLLVPKKSMDLAYYSFAGWRYHVAPLILVNSNNKNQLHVIDPTTGDKAQSVQEWAQSMGLKEGEYNTFIRPSNIIFMDIDYQSKESIMENLIEMNEARLEMGEDEFWWAYEKGLI